MKKLIAMSLIALTIASVAFAAPKKAKKAKKSKKAESTEMNISIFTIQQRQQPPEDNRAYKWIKDKFGVTFSFDILVGDKEQKKGILISDPSNLPDLVEIDDMRFMDAGLLYPLEKWIDEFCPNLKKHYSQNPTDWIKMTEADGHIYCLPNYGVYDGPDQGTFYNGNAFWIQKEVLKEFGYPKIKYIDEYFDLLEKYAKKYPEINGAPTIPFSILSASWEAFNMWNPPVFLAGSANEGDYIVVEDSSTKSGYAISFAAPSDAGKRWYKLANEKFNKGIIDAASFTDTQDQYKAKIAQGRVLGMFIQGWEFPDQENTLRTNGMANRTYAPLALTFDKSYVPHYRDRALPNIQRGYGITTNCSEEKAKKILKFMDDQLAEDVQVYLQWGEEGVDWQRDAKGEPYRTPEQRTQQEDPNWILHNKATLWTEEAPKMEGSFPKSGYACSMNNIPSEYQSKLLDHPEDLDLFKAYNVPSYAALVDADPRPNDGWYPLWQVKVPADGTDEAFIYAKYEGLFRKHLPGIIMCKPAEFDAKWADFKKDLSGINIEKYEEWFQAKLDERVEKFGGSNAR